LTLPLIYDTVNENDRRNKSEAEVNKRWLP